MDFFDDFDQIFNKLYSTFSRPVKDQRPFSVYTHDKGYIIVVNTLGIDKKDLSVNIQYEKGNKYPILCINGKSEIENINFTNQVNLRIRMNFAEKVETLSYECKNGLTLVYLKVKREEPEKLEATAIEDGDAFDW